LSWNEQDGFYKGRLAVDREIGPWHPRATTRNIELKDSVDEAIDDHATATPIEPLKQEWGSQSMIGTERGTKKNDTEWLGEIENNKKKGTAAGRGIEKVEDILPRKKKYGTPRWR